MELTKEIKEIRERAFLIGGNYLHDVDRLVSVVEDERAKPKVWDGAPEWATDARVRWTDRNGVSGHNDVYSPLYTRTLPKSRIDEIAEEAYAAICVSTMTDRESVSAIKSAILRALKEKEANR